VLLELVRDAAVNETLRSIKDPSLRLDWFEFAAQIEIDSWDDRGWSMSDYAALAGLLEGMTETWEEVPEHQAAFLVEKLRARLNLTGPARDLYGEDLT